MRLYRITDWDRHFENNRTREIRVMQWLPVPNKQDGDGYTELLDHPDGAAHFGAWVALLQVASKCDPRGTLLRDARGSAAPPHDALSLSRMTRIPISVIDAAIARLIDIGWIELIERDLADTPHLHAVLPQRPAADGKAKPQRHAVLSHEGAAFQNGREWKGREQNVQRAREARTPSPGAPGTQERDVEREFEQLIATYPRKTHVPQAQRAYLRALPELPPLERLLETVRAWSTTPEWREQGGRFTPRLDSWLDRRGWNEPVPVARPTFGGIQPQPAVDLPEDLLSYRLASLELVLSERPGEDWTGVLVRAGTATTAAEVEALIHEVNSAPQRGSVA